MSDERKEDTSDMIGALEIDIDNQEYDQHDIALAVDSTFIDHACPEWFAPSVPVETPNASRSIRVDKGYEIKILGTKRVRLQLLERDGEPTNISIEAIFKVLPVERPTLSAFLLAAYGFHFPMQQGSNLCEGIKKLPCRRLMRCSC